MIWRWLPFPIAVAVCLGTLWTIGHGLGSESSATTQERSQDGREPQREAYWNSLGLE